MSKITASADITLLNFSVLFDMSTAVPTCTITNTSTVVNAANLQWVFEFKSPSGTPIHIGDFGTPDVDGVAFTTFTFSELIPLQFGQLEFGPNAYTVKVLVKDDAGEIFDLTKGKSLCKPNGNENKGNFGKANIDIEVACHAGILIVRDHTNTIYKSTVGTQVSSQVELSYPMDESGNQLAAVSVTNIPSALPIKYEGEGHEIYVAIVYDYDLGDEFTVRVRYSFVEVFPVWCNVNLQPLLCETSRLTDMLSKECHDTVDNREKHQKLGLANALLVQGLAGTIYPLMGFNVPKIAERVKDILQIECDCCRPAGISNVGIALFTDATVTTNKTCGDMDIQATKDEFGNFLITYRNVTYTFSIYGSNAFEWTEVVTGCNKEKILNVDPAVLAEEVLTNITNSPTLLNILNGITQRAQLVCTGLDGGTIADFSACDYNVEIDTSAVGKTVTSILIGGTSYAFAGGTLVTAASTIAAFLNGLGKGTFVAVYSAGTNKTTITTTANTNVISTITTLVGSTSTVTAFNNTCGLICNILQTILTWGTNLNLVKVQAGGALSICRFNADGTVLTKAFLETDSSYDVAKYLADSLCNVVNYMSTRFVSCANIKALFGAYVAQVIDDGDTFYMNVAGKCVSVPTVVIAKKVFTLLLTSAEVKAIFCQMPPCSTVSTCSPVTGLAGSGGDTSWNYTWTTVAGAIGYKWSIDGVNYTSVTSTAAFVPGLTADTAYTFRVYPVYPFGDGSSCEVTDDFITSNTGATCAAPANLVLSSVTNSSFHAEWDAVTGASGYQYRLNGGAWINVGLVLGQTPTGLTDSTIYNFEVRALIGGEPCTESSTDSVTTGASTSENIHIQNDVSGLTVTLVDKSGVSFYIDSTGTMPLANGETLDGIHANFSGIIQATFTGTFVASCASLFVDGVVFDSIGITTADTISFDTRAYVTAEQIDIVFTEGACV